jgi:hypothetical protein
MKTKMNDDFEYEVLEDGTYSLNVRTNEYTVELIKEMIALNDFDIKVFESFIEGHMEYLNRLKFNCNDGDSYNDEELSDLPF